MRMKNLTSFAAYLAFLKAEGRQLPECSCGHPEDTGDNRHSPDCSWVLGMESLETDYDDAVSEAHQAIAKKLFQHGLQIQLEITDLQQQQRDFWAAVNKDQWANLPLNAEERELLAHVSPTRPTMKDLINEEAEG